ncbi:MAG TPA: type II secretion system F family protein [Sedimentisphaerales bacterium]|nr:type II secretion system F family protein [Sedimentisphaerales bacterium]
MLNYVFTAKNSEGNLLVGQMHADRRETVVSALKQKGYYLVSVEPESKLSTVIRSRAGLRSRVSLRDRAIFTHQLATLLKAGVQLSIALRTLSRQTQNKYLASVIGQLQNDIEQSSSLSQAMSKHPRAFSVVYTAIVGAAEESGSLAETLSMLGEQLKARASVHARIKGALTYPIFLLVVSAIVVGVLTTFVIPKFIELFVNVNQALPLPTRILVGITEFLKESWWMLILGMAVVAALGSAALRDDRIKLSVDGFLLKLPVVGTLNRKLQLAGFARTLGSLLNGGVRIVSALNTTKGTTTNLAFAKEIGNVEEAILRGATVAKVVAEQHYFDEIAANMIAVGEDTGMLPEMLLEVADMYDQECESAISSITDLLGPMMIVVLGLIIGFVVMAILLPIFETSTMVG